LDLKWISGLLVGLREIPYPLCHANIDLSLFITLLQINDFINQYLEFPSPRWVTPSMNIALTDNKCLFLQANPLFAHMQSNKKGPEEDGFHELSR
jgi:hypothetical protein